MNHKGEQLGRYISADCNSVWTQGRYATVHTTQVTEAELVWICDEWAGQIGSELSEQYHHWRLPLIFYAQERLGHFGGILGKERTYDIVVDHVRRLAGADRIRRFYQLWGEFESLDPWHSIPEDLPT